MCTLVVNRIWSNAYVILLITRKQKRNLHTILAIHFAFDWSRELNWIKREKGRREGGGRWKEREGDKGEKRHFIKKLNEKMEEKLA